MRVSLVGQEAQAVRLPLLDSGHKIDILEGPVMDRRDAYVFCENGRAYFRSRDKYVLYGIPWGTERVLDTARCDRLIARYKLTLTHLATSIAHDVTAADRMKERIMVLFTGIGEDELLEILEYISARGICESYVGRLTKSYIKLVKYNLDLI